jgi:arginine deiminase
MKQRESSLINDVNRIEKKLANEIDYSKNLENKLLNIQKELKFAQQQNDEMQETLENIKSTNEVDSIELQQQLKTLQREKEEAIKRENTRLKVIYE